jgi:tripartite-type tricarboxylate transporter receptor subunit TctC
VQAVINNDTQLTSLIPVILMPHIKAGAMKPLGASSAKRLSELPEVPTFAEAGLDPIPTYNFIGVFAPSSTPKPVIDKLNAEVVAAVREPEISKRLTDLGLEVVASSPSELDQFIASEIERWRKFTREFGVKFE